MERVRKSVDIMRGRTGSHQLLEESHEPLNEGELVGLPAMHNEVEDYIVPTMVQEFVQRHSIDQKRYEAAASGKRPEIKKGKELENRKRDEITEHRLSLPELSEKMSTSINFKTPEKSEGLSSSEAATRLARDGKNILSPVHVTPLWQKFLHQFIEFFPLLLEFAGILCIIAYAIDQSQQDNLYLGIVLLLVVLITAIFSFLQEARADKAAEGFKKFVPHKTTVRRDNKPLVIDAVDLVKGDIVEIRAGDKIPADLVLIHCKGIKVNNSSLTGEADLQSRQVGMSDEFDLETKNLVFFGTLVNEGSGYGVVVRTGDNTVIGTIAGLVSKVKPQPSPLKREIGKFIKIVSAVAISLGVIFLIVGFILGINWILNIVFAIGIIVANVPEGLLPTVTVALTLTAQRLKEKKVLCKSLDAVETLGSTSTVCSDKTGTLTQNIMTVVHVWEDLKVRAANDKIIDDGQVDLESGTFPALYAVCALNSRCDFAQDDANLALPVQNRECVGDASEAAILKFVESVNPVHDFREARPKVFEIPFNSVNKWQLSIHSIPGKKELLLTIKGAPERVMERCSSLMIDGEPTKLTKKHQRRFTKGYEDMASNGERVLAFAHCWLDPKKYTKKYPFDADKKNFPMEDFTFVGLLGLQDPPRDGVPHAVQQCKEAGVRIIMVTGDHALTAQSIAKQVGILGDSTLNTVAKAKGLESWRDVDTSEADGVVVTGAEVGALTPELWDKILTKRQVVFARTSPEQKLTIVEHCQDRGELVAVTGDGVNDSPALKKADLGCAMGITGSDVSRDAAVVVLMDDNFASIVVGIREGRIIFDNLKKCIAYTLSSNSAELAPFVFFALAGIPLALSVVLILAIDLGTDMVPSISLAYEKPESDIMQRPPRDPLHDRLVTIRLAVYSYVWLGTVQAISGYVAYLWVFDNEGVDLSEFSAFDFFNNDPDGPFPKNCNPDVADPPDCFSEDEQIDLLRQVQSSFYIAVVLVRMGCLISCKTRKLSLFVHGLWDNKVLLVGLLLEVIISVAIVYVPGITTVFGTESADWRPWIVGACFHVVILVGEEIRKWYIRSFPHSGLTRYLYW